MIKATKEVIKKVLREHRYNVNTSFDELVDRIEAAENQRLDENRKALQKLDEEKRFKRLGNGDYHDRLTG